MNKNAYLGQARIDRAIIEKGDYYATHPSMVERFISNVSEKYELGRILEPACGGGHISKVLEDYIYEVESTDLFDRGFGTPGIDFLERSELFEGSIITNPPYSLSVEFVKKSIEIQNGPGIIAMLLQYQWITTKKSSVFDPYLSDIYLFRGYIGCGKNGVFPRSPMGAIHYAWFVFRKDFSGIKEIHII
jgi:hypothetical protein